MTAPTASEIIQFSINEVKDANKKLAQALRLGDPKLTAQFAQDQFEYNLALEEFEDRVKATN